MAVTHKPPYLPPASFQIHASQLSKSALIDLVWDLLVKSSGEDVIGNGIELFDAAFEPIAILREDKMPKAMDRR